MLRAVKSMLNKSMEPFGFELRRFPPGLQNKYGWLQGLHIATVIDIGANAGQFALEIRNYLPDAFVYSFEPLSTVFEQLVENTKDIRRFKAFKYALGNENGSTRIQKNNFTPASSLLELTDFAKKAYTFTSETSEETIEIKRLDDLVQEEHIDLRRNILFKMDAQGYEGEVMRGAEKVLDISSVVLSEVCFCELYKGQLLFDDIYEILKRKGFGFKGVFDIDYHAQTGMPLFGDAIFIRNA